MLLRSGEIFQLSTQVPISCKHLVIIVISYTRKILPLVIICYIIYISQNRQYSISSVLCRGIYFNSLMSNSIYKTFFQSCEALLFIIRRKLNLGIPGNIISNSDNSPICTYLLKPGKLTPPPP